MLTEQVRARMIEAMKEGRALEKSILRVALGEIQAAEVRAGAALDDPAVAALLRKLVKANEESSAATTDETVRERLRAEIDVLEDLLPKTLSEDEVLQALAPVLEAVRSARGDGPAIGIAMKHLKAAGAVVDGRTVAAAVKKARS